MLASYSCTQEEVFEIVPSDIISLIVNRPLWIRKESESDIMSVNVSAIGENDYIIGDIKQPTWTEDNKDYFTKQQLPKVVADMLKTINNQSIVGVGNIEVAASGGDTPITPVPIGNVIVSYTTPPDGYILADGTEIDEEAYPELAAMVPPGMLSTTIDIVPSFVAAGKIYVLNVSALEVYNINGELTDTIVVPESYTDIQSIVDLNNVLYMKIGRSVTIVSYYNGVWTDLTNPSRNPLTLLLNNNNLVAYGTDTSDLYVLNGTSWSNITLPEQLVSIGTAISNNGMLYVMDSSSTYYTIDYMSYSQLPTPESGSYGLISNGANGLYLLSINNGVVYSTINNGVTWTENHLPTNDTISINNLYAVGNECYISGNSNTLNANLLLYTNDFVTTQYIIANGDILGYDIPNNSLITTDGVNTRITRMAPLVHPIVEGHTYVYADDTIPTGVTNPTPSIGDILLTYTTPPARYIPADGSLITGDTALTNMLQLSLVTKTVKSITNISALVEPEYFIDGFTYGVSDTDIYKFDTNYNLISTIPIPESYLATRSNIAVNDSTIYLAAGNIIAYYTNGIWTEYNTVPTTNSVSVAYGSGTLIAYGPNLENVYVRDIEDWVNIVVPPEALSVDNLYIAKDSNSNTIIYLIANSGIYYSTDKTTWTKITLPENVLTWNVSVNGSIVCGFANIDGNSIIKISTDYGVTWNSYNFTQNYSLGQLICGNDGNYFMCAQNNFTTIWYLYHTRDFITYNIMPNIDYIYGYDEINKVLSAANGNVSMYYTYDLGYKVDAIIPGHTYVYGSPTVNIT